MKSILQKYWLYFFLTIAIYFAFFWRLDGALLWRDEATTACWAREMAQSNSLVPKVWNGEQLIVQGAKGHDFNEHFLPSMQGWLQFYVSALFFKIFGANTFTARLPYVLLGIFGIYLLYLIFRKLFDDRRFAEIAAFVCIFSLPYLHFVRQSRYYALVIVITLAIFYELIKYLKAPEESRTNAVFVRIGIYGLLLFLSNYLTFGFLWAGLIIGLLVIREKRFTRGFLITSAAILLIVSPMIIFVHNAFIQRAEMTELPMWSNYWMWLTLVFRRMNLLFPIIPFIVLEIFLIIRYRDKINAHVKLINLFWVILITTVLISVLLVKSNAFLRYYLFMIPISLIAGAVFIYWAYSIWGRNAALIFLGILFIYHNWTSVLNMSEAVVKRQFTKNASFNKPMVEFLEQNIKQGDNVAFIRNDKGMAAYFYLPQMKWIALLEAKNPYNDVYRGRLSPEMFDDYNDADWVVVWGEMGLPARVEQGYELIWNYRFGLNQQKTARTGGYTPKQFTITQAEAGIVGNLQYYDFYKRKPE